jgi:hypothetical protein
MSNPKLSLTPGAFTLLQSVSMSIGSIKRDDVMPYISESLSREENETIEEFLEWCKLNKRTFGWNLPQVFTEYAQEVSSAQDENLDVNYDDLPTVIEVAKDAFFSVIAAEFPACKSGDLSPDAEMAFESACSDVVMAWLRSNAPRKKFS